MKKKIGLIVNPIAGMGGLVGLKGTDGKEVLEKAKDLGAVPLAPARAVEALKEIAAIKDSIEIITYPHDMGEEEARASGLTPVVMGSIVKGMTSSADTKNAARDMLRSGVDLILFAGGDGTARDIYEVVGTGVPVLGIPAGVKIHSAVFAVNPRTAGSLVIMYLQDKVSTYDAEVMDVDEEAFRKNIVSAKLYGYLKVPHERLMVQNAKIGGIQSDLEAVEAIAWDVIDNMRDDCLYIVGPGTTAKSIMKRLGLEYTLLGVDVIHQRKLIALDVNEAQLLRLIEGKKAKIVVAVIGGQGFIFGRGNQQLSSKVLRKVGKENIMVIATGQKIASLRGKPLLVDTDSSEVNEMLRGYVRVTTGYDKALIYRVA